MRVIKCERTLPENPYLADRAQRSLLPNQMARTPKIPLRRYRYYATPERRLLSLEDHRLKFHSRILKQIPRDTLPVSLLPFRVLNKESYDYI